MYCKPVRKASDLVENCMPDLHRMHLWLYMGQQANCCLKASFQAQAWPRSGQQEHIA
jgi:hypothetical protein